MEPLRIWWNSGNTNFYSPNQESTPQDIQIFGACSLYSGLELNIQFTLLIFCPSCTEDSGKPKHNSLFPSGRGVWTWVRFIISGGFVQHLESINVWRLYLVEVLWVMEVVCVAPESVTSFEGVTWLTMGQSFCWRELQQVWHGLGGGCSIGSLLVMGLGV